MSKTTSSGAMAMAHAAPRCLARTRSGTACQLPAMKGKRRCRLHGGLNPGAPKGNRNAWKHGRRSKAFRDALAQLRATALAAEEHLATIAAGLDRS